MEEFFPVLRICPLFAGMSDDDLRSILACLGAKKCFYGKNSTVLQEGDAARQLGIVLAGSVQVERTDYAGNRCMIARVTTGQLFAEAFACADEEKMPVSVVASEDASILLIDAARVLHSCRQACSFHAQLIYNLMKILAMKNLLFQQKMEVTSQRTTREKLLCYLAICAKQAGGRQFSIPFDRQELADYLQVERSGLCVEISKLRKEGVIRCTKRQFELLQ